MIPLAQPFLGKEEKELVSAAVESGWVSSKGAFITEFEQSFARYCGTKYGVATSNGTTALHLAFAALGIGLGDEVVVPTLTFIATANAVKYCNGKPVFVDSHPEYWCMDPAKLERAITPKTKAIVPVHLYGHPCDMDPILEIAKKHDLLVIEDCAEAHGALYKSKKIGGFSTISCFSFFGNKMITTGEGGMCLTDDPALDERMRMFRDHGRAAKVKEYRHDVLGFNYRMTNLQAALGVAQLRKLDVIISEKEKLMRAYNSRLKDVATLPPAMPWAKPICWLYTILVEKPTEVAQALEKVGVESRPVLLPVHQQPVYNEGRFPVAEGIYQKGITLPSYIGLKEQEIALIADTIIETANR